MYDGDIVQRVRGRGKMANGVSLPCYAYMSRLFLAFVVV
jgi:hypothetical protein